MPQYHFTTDDGRSVVDRGSVELADLASAHREAVQLLTEALRDRPELLLSTGDYEVIVTDPTRLELFRVSLALIAAPSTLHAR